MPWDQFPGNRPNKPQSPNDVASRPLPKSPVSSSLDNVVPHLIIRSPRVRPGKFVFSDAKRLLQQYLPEADITSLHSITSSARASSVGEMVRPSALAVLRLTTNSNVFGACTGSSPGLAPRRIRSTYVAARRNSSAVFTPYDINPPSTAKY